MCSNKNRTMTSVEKGWDEMKSERRDCSVVRKEKLLWNVGMNNWKLIDAVIMQTDDIVHFINTNQTGSESKTKNTHSPS